MKTIDKIDNFLVERNPGQGGFETFTKNKAERVKKYGQSGINPDDPSGEREGFVQMVANRVSTLRGYGVLSTSEAAKIKKAITKIVEY